MQTLPTCPQNEVNAAPLPEDSLTVLYYPPSGTDVIFTTPTDPPLGTLYYNRHHYGQFYISSTAPVAFKIMCTNQLKAFRDFFSHCTLSPPSSSDTQLIGTAHRQAIAPYGKKLKEAVGFFPDTPSHRFSFFAPLPLSKEIQQVFDAEVKVKHSENSLKTLVHQSKTEQIVSSLHSMNEVQQRQDPGYLNVVPT